MTMLTLHRVKCELHHVRGAKILMIIMKKFSLVGKFVRMLLQTCAIIILRGSSSEEMLHCTNTLYM